MLKKDNKPHIESDKEFSKNIKKIIDEKGFNVYSEELKRPLTISKHNYLLSFCTPVWKDMSSSQKFTALSHANKYIADMLKETPYNFLALSKKESESIYYTDSNNNLFINKGILDEKDNLPKPLLNAIFNLIYKKFRINISNNYNEKHNNNLNTAKNVFELNACSKITTPSEKSSQLRKALYLLQPFVSDREIKRSEFFRAINGFIVMSLDYIDPEFANSKAEHDKNTEALQAAKKFIMETYDANENTFDEIHFKLMKNEILGYKTSIDSCSSNE